MRVSFPLGRPGDKTKNRQSALSATYDRVALDRQHCTSPRRDTDDEGDSASTYAAHRVSVVFFFFLVADPGCASYRISRHLARALRPHHPPPEFLSSPASIATHLTLTPILDFSFTARQMAVNIGAATGRLAHAPIVRERGEGRARESRRT